MLKKSDSQIQGDVLRELKWDTRVEETEVGVEVANGIVTLTGTVSNWPKRLAAQDAAHRVLGVLDVANDIQVKLPGSPGQTDTEIAQAMRRALEWDVLVPDKQIQSTVSEGLVTLSGTVDYWSQREDAERAIRNLSGVRAVNNRIQVKASKVAQDVRLAIAGALERHALREAKNIDVAVKEGRATVSGAVQSWNEKQAVLGAARGTWGVNQVEDCLRIEY